MTLRRRAVLSSHRSWVSSGTRWAMGLVWASNVSAFTRGYYFVLKDSGFSVFDGAWPQRGFFVTELLA